MVLINGFRAINENTKHKNIYIFITIISNLVPNKYYEYFGVEYFEKYYAVEYLRFLHLLTFQTPIIYKKIDLKLL